MKYLDYFLSLFGDITVAELMTFILAMFFLYAIWKEIKKFNDAKIKEHQKKAEEEKEQKAKLDSAYEVTLKYPIYHQESIDIRDGLKKEIQEIRDYCSTLMKRFEEIEEQNKKRECSKLRDMLLQNYRYYTNDCQNPSRSWTRMESEAFWELFREYEEAGGDGYMHSVVQPEMERLTIIEVGHK
jgi:hypothetical protein